MSLRLILTRHAKSSWGQPGLSDHDRPLNGRGRKAAQAVGGWLAQQQYLPTQALISSATRTRETWERIAMKLANPPAPDILPGLYLAEPEDMLAALRTAQAPVVMLIAHNPGSAWLAQRLADTRPNHPDFHRYPTAATTVFDFDIDSWGAADWGKGQVVDFVVPRELT